MSYGEELNLTVSAKQESQEETGHCSKAWHKPFQAWHDQKFKNFKTFRLQRKINTQIFFYKKLVLNFISNYNRNAMDHCTRDNRKQKKNEETFSADAQPQWASFL